MKQPAHPDDALSATRQQAEFAVRFGANAGLAARVTVTDRGLLAVGALVSAILLSTAVVVRAASR